MFEEMMRAMDEIWLIVYRPFGFFKRIIDYSPILWKDKDWDWMPILIMLRYKIQRTRHSMAEGKIHKGWRKYVKEMDDVCRILDRVIGDDYCGKELSAHLEKWNPGRRMRIAHDESGAGMMAPMTGRERREFKALCKKMDKEMKADWDKLFSSLCRDLKNWWD